MPSRPQLTVRTAERPGRSDQPTDDRIFSTDSAVVVLDGATEATAVARNGAWMADELGRELVRALRAEPDGDLTDLLETSIQAVVDRYRLRPGASPSTTVNITRRRAGALDVLVLCDSPVIVRDRAGRIHPVRDERLDQVLRCIRPEGPGPVPPERAAEIAREFDARRNRPGGFWCASASPEAARQAIVRTFATEEVDAVLSVTDGVAVGVDVYRSPPDWGAAMGLALDDPGRLVDLVHWTEAGDPDAVRWPRTKRHDDKAAAIITIPS